MIIRPKSPENETDSTFVFKVCVEVELSSGEKQVLIFS